MSAASARPAGALPGPSKGPDDGQPQTPQLEPAKFPPRKPDARPRRMECMPGNGKGPP